MNRQNLLASLLNLRSGEGRPLALLLAHSFFVGITRVFIYTAASAIFLSEFNGELLPYVYILVALIVTAIGFTYSKIAERLSPQQMLIGTLIFLIVFVCGIRLGVHIRWLIFGFLVWARLIEVLLNLEFWALPARLFTVRQGKRLFGLISSGETLARILGGFSIAIIVHLIGTPNLLLVVLGGLIACLAVLLIILRTFPDQFRTSQKQSGTHKVHDSINLLHNRYLLLIFSLFALSVAGNFFIDFTFLNQIQERLAQQDQLAQFYGLFSGIATAILFVFTTFFSGRLISRYGITFGVRALPLVFIGGMLSVVIAGTLFGQVGTIFWLIVLTKFNDTVLRAAIDKPSLRLLYTPIGSAQRLVAQSIVEGRGIPIGAGLAGVVLLLYTSFGFSNIIYLCYVALGIAIVWFTVANLATREYSKSLIRALAKRTLDDLSMVPGDSVAVAALKQGLSSPHVGVVIYALDRLEELRPDSLPAILQNLLEHPEREVRLSVLEMIERLGISSATEAIRQRLKYEASSVVRGRSVRTLAVLGDSDLFDEVFTSPGTPDRELIHGTLVGLLRSGELESILPAGEKLLELINSPEPDDREFAAHVLGETEIQGFYRPLLQLLRDDSPQVRRAALGAAGKIRHSKLWPSVIENLAVSTIRTVAAAALVAGGEPVLQELRTAFAKAGQSREILIRVARVCGRIGGPNAIVLLRNALGFHDEQVHSQVLQALGRCGYHAEGNERALIQQHIQTEAAHATWLLATSVDLDDDEALSFLKAALCTNFARCRTHLLLLLSFLYDSHAILRVRDHLDRTSTDTASKEKRAYALEVLDVLLSSELKTLLLPLFDDREPVKRLKELSKMFPQQHLSCSQRLQDLIFGENTWVTPWTKACAFAAAVRLDMTAIIKDVSTIQEGGLPMLATVEKVMQLKAVDFFSETPEEILMELVVLLGEVDLQPGEKLFEKGDRNRAMYFIVDGQIQVQNGNHDELKLGRGEVFGELSLLDPAPCSASVTALMATHLLRLEREPFFEFIEDHNTVARKIIQTLARRLRRIQAQPRAGRPTGDVLSGIHEKLIDVSCSNRQGGAG